MDERFISAGSHRAGDRDQLLPVPNPGERIVLGFDGSRGDTGVAAYRGRDGHMHLLYPGQHIDYTLGDRAIAFAEKYLAAGVASNGWPKTEFVLTDWQKEILRWLYAIQAASPGPPALCIDGYAYRRRRRARAGRR